MARNTEFLGSFNGFKFSITRKVQPSFQNPDEFSISVHFTEPDTLQEVEIVRIDNSHGYVHLHKFFREDERIERKPSLDAFTAYDLLKAEWRVYAKKYFTK